MNRGLERRKLRLVLLLTGVFLVVEVGGGLLANSLALLADAGHMFTDVAALGLSLFAMTLALKPPSATKTYGYVRMEILAALVNGATLLVIAVFIFREAWDRVRAPEPVDGPGSARRRRRGAGRERRRRAVTSQPRPRQPQPPGRLSPHPR